MLPGPIDVTAARPSVAIGAPVSTGSEPPSSAAGAVAALVSPHDEQLDGGADGEIGPRERAGLERGADLHLVRTERRHVA